MKQYKKYEDIVLTLKGVKYTGFIGTSRIILHGHSMRTFLIELFGDDAKKVVETAYGYETGSSVWHKAREFDYPAMSRLMHVINTKLTPSFKELISGE